MYQIELDFKKGTVFIPKETAEIIGFPTEVIFLLSNVDASLLLMTGDLTRNKNAVRRGRPANSQNRSFQRSWDDKANGYRIKSTLPTRSEITKWFPGSEEGIARGVYILNGDLIDNNRRTAF